MVTLIIGGSSSGKSAYAEQLLYENSDAKEKYYLATMQAADDDARKRVERHKKLRRGKGFLTIEQPRDVDQAVRQMEGAEHAVLLECMSNLTANEMFGEQMRSAEETAEKILADLARLRAEVRDLIIVTNNVFEDGILYDSSTMEYLKALGEINQRLAREAEKVVEVVVGIPIVIKEGRDRR